MFILRGTVLRSARVIRRVTDHIYAMIVFKQLMGEYVQGKTGGDHAIGLLGLVTQARRRCTWVCTCTMWFPVNEGYTPIAPST